MKWSEAETLFPECAAQWDAQRFSDGEVLDLYINYYDELTAAWVDREWKGRVAAYAWWLPNEKRWTTVGAAPGSRARRRR